MVSTNPAVPAEADRNIENLRERSNIRLGFRVLGSGSRLEASGIRDASLGMPVHVGRRRKCEPVSVTCQKHGPLQHMFFLEVARVPESKGS